MKTKELSLDQQIALMSFLSQTLDSWLKKIANFRIPSREWNAFKKNIDAFIHWPIVFPVTLPDGKKIVVGMVNYEKMSFVAGERTGSFCKVYSLTIEIDRSIDTKEYLESSFRLNHLVEKRLQEEAEKKILKAIRHYPEANKKWEWKNGLPKDFNKKEWMLRLYRDSWEAAFKLSFATEVKKCVKIFNSAKGDTPKIPCLYGDQWFEIYESKLRLGPLALHSDYTSVDVDKEVQIEMKTLAKEFKSKYALYIANVAKKQLIGLLPKVTELVAV